MSFDVESLNVNACDNVHLLPLYAMFGNFGLDHVHTFVFGPNISWILQIFM